MTRRRDTGGVPDLVLERYRLGELPPAEAEALERRLAVEPELAARLEALDRSDEETRRRYPPAWLAEQIRQLEQENARLRQEKEILKKAVAIFTHPNQ